jgi:hypothetical protein
VLQVSVTLISKNFFCSQKNSPEMKSFSIKSFFEVFPQKLFPENFFRRSVLNVGKLPVVKCIATNFSVPHNGTSSLPTTRQIDPRPSSPGREVKTNRWHGGRTRPSGARCRARRAP